MDFIGGISAMGETTELKAGSILEFSEAAKNKFDKILGDDKIDDSKEDAFVKLTPEARQDKFNQLFDGGDFFEKPQKEQVEIDVQGLNNGDESCENLTSNHIEFDNSNKEDISEKREDDSTDELDTDIYETDDNGDTYKKNGELLPNIEYTVNGNIYKTDEYGNKVSCDSEPRYTEEGTRNHKEQKESGGDERQADDDGGHIIAKILGGAEGEENLVPMRRTINRGDYKKMENEIAKSLQEGKKVIVHIDLKYEGDSQRPSKMVAEYNMDGKKTVVEFDNEIGSTDLLSSLDDKISNGDYHSLKDEMEDMKADGGESAITSVKVEYDENGNQIKVTVGILDESTGEKSYKVYNWG